MNKTLLITTAAASVLAVAGCTSSASDNDAPASPAAAPTTQSPSPAAVDVPNCPNPHGGTCLGTLEPGEYQTTTFAPQLTYTVPAGWTNLEDLPGNFLLEDVKDPQPDDALGGSYFGMYTNVYAAAIACKETSQKGVGIKPKELVAWYQSVPGLIVSTPKKVSVGGLRGLQVDLSAKPKEEPCTFDGYAAVPLIIGDGVSQVHHVVGKGQDVRLVILGWNDGNVTLEITNVDKQHSAKDYRAQVQPIIDSMEFKA
jgi:hypothetical protein